MCTLWPVGLAELGSWSCKPPAVPVMGPGLGQEVCPVGPVVGPVAGTLIYSFYKTARQELGSLQYEAAKTPTPPPSKVWAAVLSEP